MTPTERDLLLLVAQATDLLLLADAQAADTNTRYATYAARLARQIETTIADMDAEQANAARQSAATSRPATPPAPDNTVWTAHYLTPGDPISVTHPRIDLADHAPFDAAMATADAAHDAMAADLQRRGILATPQPGHGRTPSKGLTAKGTACPLPTYFAATAPRPNATLAPLRPEADTETLKRAALAMAEARKP